MELPRARDLARQLLAESLPRRWSHTQGVARTAESIARIVGEDAGLLVGAAWLHDIGYAPELAETGLHQLDGARYLRDVEGADDRLCRLVAHHSFAIVEARNRYLANELTGEFPSIHGLLSDSLTYCDMTTSPDGDLVDVDARLDEIVARYGEGHVVAESINEARPQIKRAAEAVISVL